MEKLKITKIYTSNVDKNNNPLKTKDGKAYTRFSIKTEQYGDQWISGFENQINKNWKEGDEVEVIIKKNGQYLNFEVPKKDDKVLELLNEMNVKLNLIWAELRGRRVDDGIKEPPTDYPEEDIKPEDIPF